MGDLILLSTHVVIPGKLRERPTTRMPESGLVHGSACTDLGPGGSRRDRNPERRNLRRGADRCAIRCPAY
eukprot:680958-Rhodomonas_salina.3